ncbi:MAG: hypothetical protein OXF93_14590 [Acidobacteria bacterium]|nr:hypothetical protein [Acidobacteriota bacterium]
MPPVTVHMPVASILLGGGLLACFLGYRLMRVVLAVGGFVAGVILATAGIADTQTLLGVLLVIACGAAGALAAVVLYLSTVGLVGAGLAAFVLGLLMDGDPPVWLLLATGAVGALVTLLVRREVIIVGTSFVGAWTALVGGLALAGNGAAVAAATGDVGRLFPIAPLDGQVGFALGWAVLAALAVAVQFLATGRTREGAGAPSSPPEK